MNPLKQQIAQTFERHVMEHGYAKANLDDVARELRISKKTIYVHFDGKQDIYAHIVGEQARREKARLAASVEGLPCFSARLEALMKAVLGMARAHIKETSREDWLGEYEVAADAFRSATGELLCELVQGGMDAGEFRAGDAALVERLVGVMVLEYVQMVGADPAYDRDEELAGRIVRFVG